ncbi:MAG TPA: YbaK/EbsC family protein [Sedimenticola sp.]|nr:YbaK/EbsC family protein [Sedimenticola sp.]
MSIAKRLQSYLSDRGAEYRMKAHPPSDYSMETAEKAHVPGDALAKGIVVKDQEGHLLVVLPSDYHVDLEVLHRLLQQPVELATEEEVAALFDDCKPGAVPPIGPAYGIRTIWDPNTSLGKLSQIYFEAGDHQHLVRVSGRQFHELMAPAERGSFSRHI